MEPLYSKIATMLILNQNRLQLKDTAMSNNNPATCCNRVDNRQECPNAANFVL